VGCWRGHCVGNVGLCITIYNYYSIHAVIPRKFSRASGRMRANVRGCFSGLRRVCEIVGMTKSGKITRNSLHHKQHTIEFSSHLHPMWFLLGHVNQTRRSKWNWLGYTVRKNDDNVTKQALQWTLQGHRERGRPRHTWKRDLEKEMWTAGYKYSWRKMEAAAQDRAGRRRVVCGLCSTGSDKA